MMRWYLKYRIRLAIDRQENLPRWIQHKVDSNIELLRYLENYARMVRQLSAGSDAWMTQQVHELRPGWSAETSAMLQMLCETSPATTQTTRQPAGRFVLAQPRKSSLQWAVCLAAIVLLSSGVLFLRDRSHQSLVQQEAARNVESAIGATRAVWNEGQRVSDQSLVVWDRTLDKVARNLVDRIGVSAVSPIEDSGRLLGVAIKELHRGAAREKNGLIEMCKRFSKGIE